MIDDALLDAAAAVADGDGSITAAIADQPSGQGPLAQLQIIEQIGRVHKQGSIADSFAAAVEGHAHCVAPTPSEGVRWGELQVLERLGSGSFGDVHRAWDPTLARDVALKLLRGNRGGKQTVTEGQLLARIRHPNVMAIYGAAEIGGRVGIWGELLRGRTLATIVRHDGALGEAEVLIIAAALCRALAAVHRAGLLHRDVKAQNVIRETGGRIVLTDFGLGRELTETISDAAGTPAYLAPEVLLGGRASAQSDLYALGVLMFYLVTGGFPVIAGSIEEIKDAHRAGRRQKLHDLRPDLSSAFVQLVDRSLQPQPEDRFASAGEMQSAIVSVSHPAPVGHGPLRGRQLLTHPLIVVSLIANVVLGSVAVLWLSRPTAPPPPAPRARRLAIEPPSNTHYSSSARNMPALSPDGRFLAISATDGVTGKINLWLHSFDTATSTIVPDSERGLAPFWSPDSRALGFFDPGGVIKRVTAEGVPLGTIPTGQEPRGAAWGNGVLLYTKGPRSGLYVRPLFDAGEQKSEESLVLAPQPSRRELGYMWPQFLADGNRFIYFVLSNDADVRGLYLSSLDRRTSTLLANTDASGIVAGEWLWYVKNDVLVRQRFHNGSGRVEGEPQPAVKGVVANFDWRSVISAANDGTLSYVPAEYDTELVWFDRSGKAIEKLPLPPARYRSPALSLDGRLLAVQRYRDGVSEIQVFDLQTMQMRPSIAQSAEVQFPVWGPGHRLAYGSSDSGHSDIYVRDFDRDDGPTLLFAGRAEAPEADMMPTNWSRDGAYLAFVEYSRERPYNLWALPVSQPGQAFVVRPGEGSQIGGHVSPSGRAIVYLRRPPLRPGELPERELWASDFPSGESLRRLASGVNDPAWPTEDLLSYMDAKGVLTLLRRSADGSVATIGSFPTGVNTPESSRNNYAWTADGSRVLVNRPITDPTRVRVMLVQSLN